jgi:hypothetical protein
MNTTTKNYITVIKSVGYSADSGEVLDDSQGLTEFVEFVEDEDTSAEVTFEEGLKELKEYMLDCNAEEEDINEVESKLLKLKEKVGFKGVWRTWGVEYDMSLAVVRLFANNETIRKIAYKL